MESMYDSVVDESKRGTLRQLSTVVDFYRSNGYRTGYPDVKWLVQTMKRWGFVRITELVRLHGHPSGEKLGVDTMHAVFLGVLIKHFIYLMDIQTEGMTTVKKNMLWKRISVEFTRYCRLNRISAFCNFSSRKQFKMRMKAASMKSFAEVSCHILAKLLPPTLDRDKPELMRKKRIALVHWVDHVKIAELVDQHVISSGDLQRLDTLVTRLLVYFHDKVAKRFFTINVHYYTHLVQQIRALGPLRLVSNFSREAIIRRIKPHYRNTNFHQKEVSVFGNYMVGTFLSFVEYLLEPRGHSSLTKCD